MFLSVEFFFDAYSELVTLHVVVDKVQTASSHTHASSVFLLKRGQLPEESNLHQSVVKTNILLYLEIE